MILSGALISTTFAERPRRLWHFLTQRHLFKGTSQYCAGSKVRVSSSCSFHVAERSLQNMVRRFIARDKTPGSKSPSDQPLNTNNTNESRNQEIKSKSPARDALSTAPTHKSQRYACLDSPSLTAYSPPSIPSSML